ncbi:hypothetical protein E5Q_05293 [Mixia osmundae IAM 14324]|uniref:Uncharacterized protein n=1 Tax=Mixia osmundae (strain CBS 9802 / IAM 14324 / JCM 22182 / KY 12970) TaxID=764103 RepID=G7E6Z6_MIXOS|nr:hypothetical protein E5Q_05293 [Mixia osmundae IAM 14324]
MMFQRCSLHNGSLCKLRLETSFGLRQVPAFPVQYAPDRQALLFKAEHLVMFSRSLQPMIAAVIALCFATLTLGASNPVGTIHARDANTLERRHTGPYTWCGFQSEYEPGKVVAAGIDLVWQSGKYLVIPGQGLKSAIYEPPAMVGTTLENANFYLDAGTWDVELQLRVANNGDIQGVAIAYMTVNKVFPAKTPPFGFQCSSDSGQQNKVTIPVY